MISDGSYLRAMTAPGGRALSPPLLPPLHATSSAAVSSAAPLRCRARLDHTRHLLDHLLDGAIARVDQDRVLGPPQRRHRALCVRAVTADHVVQRFLER